MITVHHLENSRSQRVLMLLEELSVDYEIKRYARHPKTLRAPRELRALHPLGKSPIVTDGEVVLAESGAIIESLVERYDRGALRPAAGTEARRKYTYWLHYAEGSLMPLLLLKLVFLQIEKAPVPGIVRPLVKPVLEAISSRVSSEFTDPELALHLGFIDSELAKAPWFSGETFSAADIQMSFPLEAAFPRAKGTLDLPNIRAFLDRLRARPAYKRALERGGPFAIPG